MRGGRVNRAGALLECYVVGENSEDLAIEEWMLERCSFQFASGKASDDASFLKPGVLTGCFQQPFRDNVINYLDKPFVLKKLMDDSGMQMVTCSNGGGPDFSGNFFDPAKVKKTVADHIKFVRDFIVPFGYVDHFKMNMGSRPPGFATGP